MIRPLSTLGETIRWYRTIQDQPRRVQADRIMEQLVRVRLVLSHELDPAVRTPMEQVEKYLTNLLASRSRELQKPKIKIHRSYDISSRLDLSLQRYRLSCEIAATRIALSALGRQMSEDQILSRLSFSSIDPLGSDGVWGDPDLGFVGRIAGSQAEQTGYGVYEAPLQDFLANIDYHSEILNESRYTELGMTPAAHLSILIDQLRQDRQVVLWGDWCTDPQYEDGTVREIDMSMIREYGVAARNTCSTFSLNRQILWMTPEGKNVSGLIGEHAFVLLGYIGDPMTPTHIIVWDTDTGRHTYPITEWMRKWSAMQYRSLIIWK